MTRDPLDDFFARERAEVRELPAGPDRWEALLAEGLYVNLARPPATPAGMTLLRCSLCAEHSDAEVGEILRMFENAGKTVGVI